jgi:TolB protein
MRAGLIVLLLATAGYADDGLPAAIRLTTDGHLKQRPMWSPDGKQIVFARHEGATIFLFVRDENGSERRLTTRNEPEFDAAFAPDGKRLALALDKTSPNQGDIEVFTVGVDGQDLQSVATSPGKLTHEEWPSWSPDGQWLAFTSTRDDNQEVYVARPDGQQVRRLTTDPAIDAHPAWSPDGRQIVFATNRWGDLELAVMPAEGGPAERLTASVGLDDYPAWSPDGRRIAFASNRDGNLEIYTVEPSGKDPQNRTRHPGIDNFPSWSPFGKLIWVSSRDGSFDLYTE